MNLLKILGNYSKFLDRNFSVIAFDWRGQGMSENQPEDIHKSYIKDYKRHDKDLKYILEEIIEKNFPKPLIGIGILWADA